MCEEVRVRERKKLLLSSNLPMRKQVRDSEAYTVLYVNIASTTSILPLLTSPTSPYVAKVIGKHSHCLRAS